MQDWGKETAKESKIDISASGIAKALEAGREDFLRRERDREVVVFSYLVDSILYTNIASHDAEKAPIERLFELLDTRTYRRAFERGMKHYGTDETPTDFFRDLYNRFRAWQGNPRRKDKEAARKNYGARSLESRWELGEFPKEKWMSKNTTGEKDD